MAVSYSHSKRYPNSRSHPDDFQDSEKNTTEDQQFGGGYMNQNSVSNQHINSGERKGLQIVNFIVRF